MPPSREVPFFGEFYRRTTGALLTPRITREEAAFIGRELPMAPGEAMLDLGCGEGRHLAQLASSGAILLGLDVDHGSLQEAKAHASAIQGDLRALPLRSASQRAIYCWYSTLFVFSDEENRRALAEVARVLAPGGRLLFQSVNPHVLAQSPTASFDVTLPDGATLHEEASFDLRSGRDSGVRTVTLPSGEMLCGRYAIRYYSLSELTELFQSVGLIISRTYGGVSGEEVGRKALDLIVLATKEDRHGD